ncbi:hypothetical protein D5F01_LYC07540 [Larimichthys crocea]|uniref:Uncharacterized protein n=1 Tax=Larimichthys crocea TaxID=215358 RepID=A0A6G0ITL8_LARCR|nr:hypothetical protein D5F01_LYC07540 [Larimichthys crocea]
MAIGSPEEGNPHHITRIMAQKNTSGANTIPRLVVKIIGSKQVKQFIEEPREADTSKKEENLLVEAEFDDDFKKPPERQDATMSMSDRQNRVDSALWAVINQVPNRMCVTAPSGDRSRSYIHPKTHHSCDPRAAEIGVSEDRDKAELSSAVREELSDWQLSSLRSAEDDVAALDPAITALSPWRRQVAHKLCVTVETGPGQGPGQHLSQRPSIPNQPSSQSELIARRRLRQSAAVCENRQVEEEKKREMRGERRGQVEEECEILTGRAATGSQEVSACTDPGAALSVQGIPRRQFPDGFPEQDGMNSTSLTRKETERKEAASAPAGPQ